MAGFAGALPDPASNLVGLVLIMDARRPLTELDRKMIDWFAPTGRPIHCLLTKSDKLTRQEQTKTLRETRARWPNAAPDFGADVLQPEKDRHRRGRCSDCQLVEQGRAIAFE
jgi:GTP-binding protein EngB required for normal cell division